MSNFAAIDIGTNSIRLMITSPELNILARETTTTRLGKNVDITDFMAEENINETIDVLGSYLELCKKHEVKTIYAVATNVFRRASNSKFFLKKVYEKTGLKVRIISGLEEAGLVFKGVTKGFKSVAGPEKENRIKHLEKRNEEDRLKVIDIGGGSCELISGKYNGSINSIKSIELGSVRITEKFFNKDRLAVKDLLLADRTIKKILIKEFSNIMIEEDTALVGVGGTISTIGSIFLGLKKYEREKLNGLLLPVKEIEIIFTKLYGLSLEERKKIAGLQPERADIIIGGIAILLAFMKYFKRDSVILSEHDILDGIIYSLV